MFFLVRELSLTLMEEEENKLPLTKDKDCVKIDNILDLSKFPFSGDGNDMNPALPDTSMKLGRYVYKHELFEIFSLANQNYSNFQDGGSKFQDGYQNKY